jgi:hypothetical protein
MSTSDPWKITSIQDAVPFANYLSGSVNGGYFQSTPAFFQRGIEWDKTNVSAVLQEVFPSNLDPALLDLGRRALVDARHVAENACGPNGQSPCYESGTDQSKPFFHDIDIQAIPSPDGTSQRKAHLVDGQQRTTFWRCAAMALMDMLITHKAPTIPQSLSNTLWSGHAPTMTFGQGSSYDRLSKPFCVAMQSASPAVREKILKDHLDILNDLRTNNKDPMVKLYLEIRAQLRGVVLRIASWDKEKMSDDIQAAIYVVVSRLLFDCEVRVNLLPINTLSGKHFFTKNSRGAPLSEHALITSALHEHGHTKSDDSGGSMAIAYVDRWRKITAKLKEEADKSSKAGLVPGKLLCHATSVAMLGSHSNAMSDIAGEYLSNLAACQKQSAGNAFKVICALKEASSLDVDVLLDRIESLLPDFINLYIAGSDAHMQGVPKGIFTAFKQVAKGSHAHAVLIARVFGCPPADVVAVIKTLTAAACINGVYELASAQGLVPKIGRFAASLNNAITHSIKAVTRKSSDPSVDNKPDFARVFMKALINGNNGSSPYYDQARRDVALKAIPDIEFGKNNDTAKLLMRLYWHSVQGNAATLLPNDLEHILPLNPSPLAVKESGVSVTVADPAAVKDCPKWKGVASRLGNMAWLPPSTNRSIGNRSFSEKKLDIIARYNKGQGQGHDAIDLLNYATFGEQQVADRGLAMATKIGLVWNDWIGENTKPPAKILKTAKPKACVANNPQSQLLKQAA